MSETSQSGVHVRWAQSRFAVVGRLLAAPPPRGQLRAELQELAARNARQDPVAALRRKIRKDAGRQRAMGSELRRAVQAQYQARPSWSCAATPRQPGGARREPP